MNYVHGSHCFLKYNLLGAFHSFKKFTQYFGKGSFGKKVSFFKILQEKTENSATNNQINLNLNLIPFNLRLCFLDAKLVT